MNDNPSVPRIDGVLETALYVADLETAKGFYAARLGLRLLAADHRFCAFDAGGRSVLLLFQKGSTLDTVHLPGGTIPPHDGGGPVHFAFAISTDDLPAWRERLAGQGIEIEGTTDWPRGGHSLYFRDHDRHLVELATPGIWQTY